MTGKWFSMHGIAGAVALALAAAGCSGSDGAQGPQGPQGIQGPQGTQGPQGPGGTPGADAPIPPLAYSVFTGSPVSTQGGIAQFHGQAVVTAIDETQGTPTKPKYLAKVAITGATADPTGLVTVSFTVKNKLNQPVLGLGSLISTTAPAYGVSAGIFKLAPKGDGRSFNRWVPYIYRSGRTVNAGYRESTTSTPAGSLTENGGGSYTYTFGTNLASATFPFDPSQVPTTTAGAAVGYDRTLTHRVSIYLGGHAGPTGEADFDFVPDGSAVTQTRNIVQTAACQKCHAANEFRGHGGDRTTVEGCNTCHSPDGWMVNGAVTDALLGFVTTSIDSLAMQVMIHKIHAGRELETAPGPDGIYFDDPATVTSNEAADNGTYRMGSLGATWRSAAFPAGLANCTVCHTGTGQDVDNWKTVPSREACGSCHDGLDFTTGIDRVTGFVHMVQTSDDGCAACHPAAAIAGYHDFMTKDIRNSPEFAVTVTVSTPGNGTHFVAGEAPKLTIKLWNLDTNAAVDHTTIVEDPSGEGCTPNATFTACTNAADGLFRNANLYVTGPRAKRIPVLTYGARAKISSATTGPWNLSAGGSLRVIVDGGNFIVDPNHVGEDVLVPGDITLTLPANATSLFANPAAATAAEIVAWLNGPTAEVDYNERIFTLGDRAVAYVENGMVFIRSRAKGSFNPSIQVPELSKALGLFTDTAVKVGSTGTQVRKRTTTALNDPKAAWFTDRIEYTLDPVDDLAAGTYMINVEFADRGRPSNAANYRTPSIAVATFQVKQAGVEKPVAAGCTSCHWNTDAVGQGSGLVMDPVRHNKPFNAQALDQCGGCHGYMSRETVAARTWTTGGGNKAISKRVHAVHNGASLNYPILTVDHEESVAGRDWKIVYPQEVRNCESCHPAVTTSGTWATIPNRLACMGCHDADAATIHMKSQVSDPTPTAPWSGDEVEACAACH